MKLNDTQYELAIRTGLARKTINAMENGRFWIGMKQYILICEALHLFPAVAEMGSDEQIAVALRKNWTAKPKVMSIEDALKLKAARHKRPEQDN